MQEAGLVNFLRTILVILLIYYVLKLIARYVFPLFFKKMMSSMEKKFNEQQQNKTSQGSDSKIGETVVDKTPSQGRSNDKVGEYVDFEEVDN